MYLCPKLLNFQFMFWKSNFILEMQKLFGHGSKVKLNSVKLFFKKCWHSRKEIRFHKHDWEIRSFSHLSLAKVWMYRIDQGHLTVFCIVLVWLEGPPSPVRIITQVLWFMYQNRLGPSGGIYYLPKRKRMLWLHPNFHSKWQLPPFWVK